MSASQGELYKLEKTKFFEIAAHHLTFLGMQSLCWLACVALSTGTCHRSVARCTFCYRSGGGGAGQPSNSRFDQETAQDEASAVWPDGYQCHLLSLVGTTRMESFVCKTRAVLAASRWKKRQIGSQHLMHLLAQLLPFQLADRFWFHI